ncbi:hypothetical protein LOD99_4878 [Oopsacas minuta]|uniref:Uncharacterized protein n=1 Tax=Oopsacas minuta TaxID=111878 RepID=A0AAV7JSD6_9METZ|nr:hypothetical protein LOD99_4878 [Oopsacas minuta]
MSGTPDPKRGRYSHSPTDDLFTDDSVTEALNWDQSQRFIPASASPPLTTSPLCVSCSSVVCPPCTHKIRDLKNTETRLQSQSPHVDKDLLQSIPKPIQRPHRTPADKPERVQHFRLPLLSDDMDHQVNAAIVEDIFIDNVYATRSHVNVYHKVDTLSERFTYQSILSHSESEIKQLTLDLNKLPKFTKLAILGPLFQQCTAKLNSIIEKSQVEGYSHVPEQIPTCTQLSTVGSYGLRTLLDSCDNHPNYLFTPKICNQVLTIISCISHILLSIPEVRELVFLDENTEISSPPPSREELILSLAPPPAVSRVTSAYDGIRYTTKPKYPKKTLYNRSDTIDKLSLFDKCTTKDHESYSYSSIVRDLVNQISIILTHPQMNLKIIISCLNMFSKLNVYNPGNGPECVKNLLRDGHLNVIFDLDTHDHSVPSAVMRLYTTIPLTPYFTPCFNLELFKRFISFIRAYQKPVMSILQLKSRLLSLLTNTIQMHPLPFSNCHLFLISDLTQNILSSYSFHNKYKTLIAFRDLLLTIQLAGSFLLRDHPDKLQCKNDKQEQDKLFFQKVDESQVFASIIATFELLENDNLQTHKNVILCS